MINDDLLRELMDKYVSGELSAGEKQLFARLLQDPGHEAEVSAILRETFMGDTFGREENAERTDRFLAGLHKKMPQQRPLKIRIYRLLRVAAAAAILILLAGGGYELFHRHAAIVYNNRFRNDVAPGHHGATLTLSTGDKMLLDSLRNGVLQAQGNIRLVKKDDELIYTGKSRETIYNTVTTAAGRWWKLTLSDSTKVWLNALSSIRYPVSFPAGERAVQITGEVYFQVTKDPSRPFRVTASNQEITVLGTEFNINDYQDEGISRTTLIEGRVKVDAGPNSTILQPGQQWVTGSGNTPLLKQSVNLQEVVAWKNGEFDFVDAPTQDVLRQLARWYDIRVSYQEKVDQYFNGKISRDEPLSKVLQLLELTGGVHFRIEGNKVTVMNQTK